MLLHASIEGDVKSLLDGKTSTELEDMQSQIESQMRSGTAKVVEYWEAIQKQRYASGSTNANLFIPLYKVKRCIFVLKIRMHGFID